MWWIKQGRVATKGIGVHTHTQKKIKEERKRSQGNYRNI